jgi:hypothetical protein
MSQSIPQLALEDVMPWCSTDHDLLLYSDTRILWFYYTVILAFCKKKDSCVIVKCTLLASKIHIYLQTLHAHMVGLMAGCHICSSAS